MLRSIINLVNFDQLANQLASCARPDAKPRNHSQNYIISRFSGRKGMSYSLLRGIGGSPEGSPSWARLPWSRRRQRYCLGRSWAAFGNQTWPESLIFLIIYWQSSISSYHLWQLCLDQLCWKFMCDSLLQGMQRRPHRRWCLPGQILGRLAL